MNENGCIITILVLNRDYIKQIEPTQALKVKSPDGHIEYFRQGGLTNGSQHVRMWQHCGCSIEKVDDPRQTRGMCINGIAIEFGDSKKILKYISNDKLEAKLSEWQ